MKRFTVSLKNMRRTRRAAACALIASMTASSITPAYASIITRTVVESIETPEMTVSSEEELPETLKADVAIREFDTEDEDDAAELEELGILSEGNAEKRHLATASNMTDLATASNMTDEAETSSEELSVSWNLIAEEDGVSTYEAEFEDNSMVLAEELFMPVAEVEKDPVLPYEEPEYYPVGWGSESFDDEMFEDITEDEIVEEEVEEELVGEELFIDQTIVYEAASCRGLPNETIKNNYLDMALYGNLKESTTFYDRLTRKYSKNIYNSLKSWLENVKEYGYGSESDDAEYGYAPVCTIKVNEIDPDRESNNISSADQSIYTSSADEAVCALQNDCPQYFLWEDSDAGFSVEFSKYQDEENVMRLVFTPFAEYEGEDGEILWPTYGTAAYERAQEIIESAEELSDYDKILEYVDAIDQSARYNGGTTDGNEDDKNAQILSVFSGENQTVSAETLSRAFDYLLDMTEFSNDVTGLKLSNYDINLPWNFVRMEDGKYYVVDVADSIHLADGSKSGYGQIVLKGGSAESTGNGRYTVTIKTSSGSDLNIQLTSPVANVLFKSNGATLASGDYVQDSSAVKVSLKGIEDAALKRAVKLAMGYDEDHDDTVTMEDIEDLTRLDASDANVESLEGIGILSGLEVLNISDNDLDGLDGIEELYGLKELDASGCGLKSLDELVGLTELERLNLSRNSIEEVIYLTNMQAMQVLQLQDNEITDLTGLPVSSLTYLDLSENNLRDISKVAEAKELTDLFVKDNLLGEIPSLAGLKALKLYANRIPVDMFSGNWLTKTAFKDKFAKELTDAWYNLNIGSVTNIMYTNGGTSGMADYDYSMSELASNQAISLLYGYKDYFARDNSAWLNTSEKKLYDILRKHIIAVSAGEENLTSYDISLKSLGINTGNMSARSLGMNSLYDEAGRVSEDAWMALWDKTGMADLDVVYVLEMLNYDLLMNLYWVDKDETFTVSNVRAAMDGSYMHLENSLVISLKVGDDWKLADTVADTTKTGAWKAATENLKTLDTELAGQTGYDKLKTTYDYIRNVAKADGSVNANSYGYWDMFYVLDDNTETSPTAYGYATAFDYIRSNVGTYDRNLYSQIGSGTLAIDIFDPEQVYVNIVSMSGTNYLVDAANGVFLKGAVRDENKVYTMSVDGQILKYTLDGESDRMQSISRKDYGYASLAYASAGNENGGEAEYAQSQTIAELAEDVMTGRMNMTMDAHTAPAAVTIQR